jgi:hypothetical protein
MLITALCAYLNPKKLFIRLAKPALYEVSLSLKASIGCCNELQKYKTVISE